MAKELINLYIRSEWKKKWFLYLKQILFLVPVLTLILVMISSENIKYLNQWEFLHNTSYTSVSWKEKDSARENRFRTYHGTLSIVEKHRGATIQKKTYNCQIFNLQDNSDYDFEYTYFSQKNMGGFDIHTLGDDEILISYDVAKKLSVKTGDTVHFISDETEETVAYCVAGIMKTKYQYQNIGYTGTVLLHTKDSTIQSIYPASRICTFYKDETGEITKAQEMQDANCLLISIKSKLVINVVMPLFGMFLIVLILYREIKRLVKRLQYNYAVFVTLGMEERFIYVILAKLEVVILLISNFLSMLLYKYWIMEYYMGRYVSMRIFVLYMAIILGMSILVLFFCTKKMKNEISNIDLIQSLKLK